MRKNNIGHFYIVGAPRSGTTLMQSLIGSHSQIVTFRELDYFSSMCRNQRKRQRLLNIPAADFRRHYFKQFLERTNSPPPRLPLIFCWQYAFFYLHRLDTLTRAQSKGAWLDKTPDYILFMDKIEHYIPNAKFIHVVRNGPDNVASIYDTHLKFPFTMPWQFCTLAWAVNHWKQCIEITLMHFSKPNHLVVGYTDLVEDTIATLQRVCDFLQIPFEPAMIENYTQMRSQLGLESVPWQRKLSEPIVNHNGEKFAALFPQDIQCQILEKLSSINLSKLSIRP